MKNYNLGKDRTAIQRFAAAGVPYRKTCSACHRHCEIRGGSVRGKLRLWRCMQCTQASLVAGSVQPAQPARPGLPDQGDHGHLEAA
jgi:hypothetical protein